MAYLHKQTVEGIGGTNTNVNAAALTTVAAGDTIWGRIFWTGLAATPVVTDTIGNTYTVVATQFNDSNYRQAVFYRLSSGSGSNNVVNVALGGSRDNLNVVVTQASGLGAFIGVAYSSVLLTPGTGSNAMVTDTINITGQPARLWGVCLDLDGGGGTDATAGTGFTDRGELTDGTAEDKQILATGDTTCTWTSAFGSHSYIVAAMAFTEATGGSTYTLTAAQGSFTLVGQDAYRKIAMAAVSGSYALNGQAAQGSKTILLVADTGTYALTGSQGFIDLSMAAASGSYALTGQSAVVGKTFLLVAGSGSFTTTGVAANLVWSNPPVPTPVTGARPRHRGFLNTLWSRRG